MTPKDNRVERYGKTDWTIRLASIGPDNDRTRVTIEGNVLSELLSCSQCVHLCDSENDTWACSGHLQLSGCAFPFSDGNCSGFVDWNEEDI